MTIRKSSPYLSAPAASILLGALLIHLAASAGADPCPPQPAGALSFESLQARSALAVTPDGTRILACNTAAGTLSVLDPATRTIAAEIPVGLEPVSVAVHPDGRTAYVANHVSDSLSVIDLARLVVTETIQEVEPERLAGGEPNPEAGRTRFDAPAEVVLSGDGSRAYVSLSGMDQVAVIDTATQRVIERFDLSGSLPAPGGERAILHRPRALALLGEGRYLAVASFDSGNRTETRFVQTDPVPPSCDPEARRRELFAREFCFPGSELCRNVGPYGPVEQNCGSFCFAPADRDVVRNPEVPDRDVAVLDTETGAVTSLLGDVGTLIYSLLAVPGPRSGEDRLLVVHMDARNQQNGTFPDELRPWLNRLSELSFVPGEGLARVRTVDLDAPQSRPPDPAAPAAIPYGIAAAGGALYVTASGSDRLLILDGSFTVVARPAVAANPTAVLASPSRPEIYVLNRLGHALSVVDPATRQALGEIPLGADPLARLRAGARVVHDASLSGNGSFACASCHPGAGVDQLAWDLGREMGGVDEVGPRVTQSLRGLAGTEGFHWDGKFATLTSLVTASVELMGGSIDPARAAEAQAFLESIAPLPARGRAPDDRLSAEAKSGMGKFFEVGAAGQGLSCASAACHAPPFQTSTARTGGMQPVTLRGLFDRRQVRHDGTNSSLESLLCYQSAYPAYDDRIDARAGIQALLYTDFEALDPERDYAPLIRYLEEQSAGLVGVLGRQVTTTDVTFGDPLREEIRAQLQRAAELGKVLLAARGAMRDDPASPWQPVSLTLDAASGRFCAGSAAFTSAELDAMVAAGDAVLTFSALPSARAGEPGAELHELCLDCTTSRVGEVPRLVVGEPANLTVRGRGFDPSVRILVDGDGAPGSPLPDRPAGVTPESLTVAVPPLACCAGEIRALQAMNAGSRPSNELPLRLDCARLERLFVVADAGLALARVELPASQQGVRVFAVGAKAEIPQAHSPRAPLCDGPSECALGAVAGPAGLTFYEALALCGDPPAEGLPD